MLYFCTDLISLILKWEIVFIARLSFKQIASAIHALLTWWKVNISIQIVDYTIRSAAKWKGEKSKSNEIGIGLSLFMHFTSKVLTNAAT